MKIARFSHDDAIMYGIIDDRELVVLAGDPMFSGYETTGARVPLTEVTLLAPVIPRSKVVCVGKNYHDHAAEMGEWPRGAAAFPQAEHRCDRPGRRDRASHRAVRANGVRGRARGRDRTDRQEREGGERPRPRARLHDRQRRHRTRPAAQGRAVVAGEGLRHVLPARSRDRDGLRPGAGHDRDAGERRGPSACAAHRHDPLGRRDHRVRLCGVHAPSGRRHHDGDPGGRGHVRGGRHGRGGDLRARHPAQHRARRRSAS